MGGSIAKPDSDAKLREVAQQPQTGGPGPNTVSQSVPIPSEVGEGKSADDTDDVIPTVFTWNHGGNEVFITGSFNNWSKKIRMHKSNQDFSVILNLPRGVHCYKFIVDNEWRFSPEQSTTPDTAGNVNNMLDLRTFQPDIASPISAQRVALLNEEGYGQQFPREDEYNKEPPTLPPHLRHIILNSQYAVESLLPEPQHVSLHHLYCTGIREGVVVQGCTQRFRNKFATSVYFSVMPLSKQQRQDMDATGSSGSGEAQRHAAAAKMHAAPGSTSGSAGHGGPGGSSGMTSHAMTYAYTPGNARAASATVPATAPLPHPMAPPPPPSQFNSVHRGAPWLAVAAPHMPHMNLQPQQPGTAPAYSLPYAGGPPQHVAMASGSAAPGAVYFSAAPQQPPGAATAALPSAVMPQQVAVPGGVFVPAGGVPMVAPVAYTPYYTAAAPYAPPHSAPPQHSTEANDVDMK